MAKKIITNQEAFRNLAKNADQMYLAVIRASIVTMAENNLKNRDKIIADHKDSMFSGELIVAANEEILKYLGFKGE